MHSFPVFMKISGRRCVVIGGGDVAMRKVAMLLKADAVVEVISPVLNHELASLLAAGKIHYIQAIFSPGQLDGAMLVIAATDDETTNHAVSVEAKTRNIPVNVVDAPDLCTFTSPSIIDRSPIIIAISSGATSPVLARMIRARIETLVPATYGRLSALAAENGPFGRYRSKMDRVSSSVLEHHDGSRHSA